MECAAKASLSPEVMARLAVIAFLHDVGKLNPGFQAKGWPKGLWTEAMRGHVTEGAAIFGAHGPAEIAHNLCLDALIAWCVDFDLLHASLAHHGRPFRPDIVSAKLWRRFGDYDPVESAARMGSMIPLWFSAAFAATDEPLPSTPDFQHLFCGLVSLADWLGSDRRFFSFAEPLDADYMAKARAKAEGAVKAVGLDVRAFQMLASGRATFTVLTGFDAPRPQQSLVGDYSLDEHLVIFEAETGSGKTEAALWRFARLFEAGLVDSLYFALPTRAAAVQIHGRVNSVMQNMLGDQAPEAVLAVPGYLKVGETQGQSLPDWKVRWDDHPDEARLLARWAAESAKRYLAATVAVGTIDQAMLAALQVKHAHLRAAALSRSFIVIDEVHASDRFMTEVQNHLLKMHLGRGGYAMLMSATLGSVARVKWLGRKTVPSFAEAAAAPYPAIWGKAEERARGVRGSESQKTVAMELAPTMAAADAARRAIAAARQGARVLVIRNTVASAVATWEAVRQATEENLLLQVGDGPALHHSRFAPEDRKLLDQVVESALSPNPELRPKGGVIVIGTQTLEQSLDVCADLLMTDLCPVDVLLQRIGRLHRHRLARPVGFETPHCVVFTPENGLEPLLKPAFENGLGGWIDNGVLQGVYRDLSILELTRRLIETRPQWAIPAMNRRLVESATHPEQIDALHDEMAPAWRRYWNDVYGKDVADAGAAKKIALQVHEPFSSVLFPSDEETIRTRLGAEGARIEFVESIEGPFGQTVTGVTLPAHWSRGIDAREPVAATAEGGTVRFSSGGAAFLYNRKGLARDKQ